MPQRPDAGHQPPALAVIGEARAVAQARLDVDRLAERSSLAAQGSRRIGAKDRRGAVMATPEATVLTENEQLVGINADYEERGATVPVWCRRAVRIRGRVPPDSRGPREAGRDLHRHGH